MRLLKLFVSVLVLSSCGNSDVQLAKTNLEGNWVFKGYQNGDDFDQPCDTTGAKATLIFKQGDNSFAVSGRSFINSYFSDANLKFDNTGKTGQITFNEIGMTLMAGPKVLMDCENRYSSELIKVEFLKLDNNKLFLSREAILSKSTIPETMVFEKEEN